MKNKIKNLGSLGWN